MKINSSKNNANSSKKIKKRSRQLAKSNSCTLICSKINASKDFLNAIEDYKKLCVKYLISPHPLFNEQITKNQITFYLENYSIKDIIVISQVISKYFYFKHIKISDKDPNKKRYCKINYYEIEKEKREKDQKNQKITYIKKNIYLIQGISNHIRLSLNLISFSITNLILNDEIVSLLTKSLSENISIQGLAINNCKITDQKAFELIIGSLLIHPSILYIDLSYNNLKDKYGKILGRLITRQSQRRDQVIWAYGLRNEKPPNNDYTRGLISIGLKGNLFNEITSFNMSNSLLTDQYIRSIDLSENNLNKESCKMFIKIMRKNNVLLNLDLQNNPGYDEEIHARIVMKMSKNIKILYSRYLNDEFREDEFNEIKGFINQSFFDVDIPEKIIEVYNSNFDFFDENKKNLDNYIQEDEEEEDEK
jgi:hypothetical protein